MENFIEFIFWAIALVAVGVLFAAFRYAFGIQAAESLRERYHCEVMTAIMGLSAMVLIVLLIILNSMTP